MSINIDTKINLNSSQFTSGAKNVSSAIDGINKSFQQLDTTKVKLDGISASTFALAKAYENLGRLQNMISDVMGGAYNYATAMETNTVGISAILKSMVQVNGETMKWNQSMEMSKDLMAKLRIEALQTASTSTDLIETFRGILGPALNQGMSIDQTMTFTKVGVNAVRSLGLPSNQYLQELRSILQGNIRPSSSTLATALGITNQDVKEAKNNAGGVFKFLMERMEGFERATKETTNTVEGRIAILKEGLYTSMEEAGKLIYYSYNNWLGELSDKMFTLNKQTGQINLNKDFVAGVKEVASDFYDIGKVVGKIANGLLNNAGGIFKGLEMFAMFKGGQMIANSGLNLLDGFVERFTQAENLFFDIFGKNKTNEIEVALVDVIAKTDQLVAKNKELETIINEIPNGVKNLASHYASLGVSAEEALKWQQEIEKSIYRGDNATARSLQQQYEAQAMQIQKENEQRSLEEQRSAIQERINKLKAEETAYINDSKNEEAKANELLEQRLTKQQTKLKELQVAQEEALKSFDSKSETRMINLLDQIKKQEEQNIKRENAYLEKKAKLESKPQDEKTQEKLAKLNSAYAEKSAQGLQRQIELEQKYQELCVKNAEERVALIEKQNQKAQEQAERVTKLEIQKSETAIKYQNEQNDIISRTLQLTKQQEELLKSVNANQNANRQVAGEIVRLTQQEIAEQQRAILIYELKNKAELTGDKQIIAATNEIIKVVQREGYIIQQTGREGVVAYDKLIDAIKRVTQGSMVLDEALIKQMNTYAKLDQETKEHANTMEVSYVGALGSVGVALYSVREMLGFFTNDVDTNAGQIAEWCLKAGAVAIACDSMISSIGALKKAYDALASSIALTRILQIGGAALAKIGGVATLAGLALSAGAGYLAYNGMQTSQGEKMDMLSKQMQANKKANDEARENIKQGLKDRREAQREAEELAKSPLGAVAEKYKDVNYIYNPNPQYDDGTAIVESKFDDSGDDDKKKKGGYDRAAKELEKQKTKTREAQASYKSLTETIDIAYKKLTDTYTDYQIEMDEAKKKTDDWSKSLVKMVADAGGVVDEDGKIKSFGKITEEQYKKAKKSMEDFYNASEKKALETQELQGYKNQLQHIQNMESLGELSKRMADERRSEVLKDEIAFYQKQLEQKDLTEKAKLDIETDMYNARKALRDAEASESKIQWDSVLEHIRNTSFNLTETFNGGIDTMIGRFTEFGQNIIGSTKTVTEQLRELCKNLASDILNMMMKIYMQGLMMNLIGNIFGGGGLFGGGSGSIGSTPSMLSSPSVNSIKGIGLSGIGVFAKGGVANGWSIVGEKGPELVNFSNPGRVYTADQTRNALSGGGGVNIKIDLHNESGQQVEAQTTGTNFDGESYVVGVVLKAISTNKNGMRNIIKGVATT